MEMFKRIVLVILFAGWTSLAPSKAQPAQATPPALPPPDVQNASYGPHERNVLDLWKARSAEPAPLVLFIHGGGFRQGDKKGLNPNSLKAYLDAGFSVAAINYRLTDHRTRTGGLPGLRARAPVSQAPRERVEPRSQPRGLDRRLGGRRYVDVARLPRRPGATQELRPGRPAVDADDLRRRG